MPQELWPPLVIPDRSEPTHVEEDDQTTLFPPPLLEGRLSDTITLVASINLLLDESPQGIAAGRPAPLSAEPGPQIDYRLVSCVLSVTHKSLSRDDCQKLQAVDRLRHRYFSAHGILAHLHRAIQDLWAQRQLLVDRAEQIKIKIMYNNNNNNNNSNNGDEDCYRTFLHQNAISQSLNLKQAHEALERYYRCAKGVADHAGLLQRQGERHAGHILCAEWISERLGCSCEGGSSDSEEQQQEQHFKSNHQHTQEEEES
ncbi:hypothetical protein VTN00DRAFT_7772 [Thermoascus crustaceus]|uniref:uncharacterized protein n=1 Tax=Thermoascus crustaceus TaxID=5088 RepID=UPI003742FE20